MTDLTKEGLNLLNAQEKRALLEKLLRQKSAAPQIHALSYGQKALWFLQHNHPETSAYNAAYCVRIASTVQVDALREAFQQLVNRHPMLRTTYREENGEPVQVIHARKEVDFSVVDCAGLSDAEIDARVRESYREPFDLKNDSVARFRLFTQTSDRHVLLLTIHHIACDAWSIWVLMNEFRQVYPALCKGETADLPALNHTYINFAEWQNQLTRSAEGERLWEYWQGQLNHEIPALDLPADFPYPPARRYEGATEAFRVPGALVQKIHACAKDQGATLYMALLAAFNVLLHRYTGQEDLVVGSPTSGRTQTDFAPVVGYCVNPVALRSTLAEGQTFAEYLGEVRHTVLDALTHQDYPLPLLVERMRLTRDPSRTPLFQTMFILQKPPQSDEFLQLMTPGEGNVNWGGLDLQPYELPQMEGQFDLTLEILEKAEQAEGLFGVLKYNTDIFTKETIQRIQSHFVGLLEAIVAAPETEVLKLMFLSDAEQKTIVREWNDTRRDYTLDRSLHSWIEEQVEKTPSAVAVEGFSAEGELVAWTYEELNAWANRLAHELRSRGVGRDTVVGVCTHRSLEMVGALVAVLKAGGAYLPLDPDLPGERLRYMAGNANVSVVLSQRHLIEEHVYFSEPNESITTICLDEETPVFSSAPKTNPTPINQPDDLAYVIYTSGSTGRPKGVMNTHRAICNRLFWMQDEYQIDEDDRVLQKTPYSFDVSVWEFFWPLMTGARMVVAKPNGHKDNAYLADLIQKRQVTTLHFVPSMLKAFLGWDGVEDCASLKRVICSGEALTVEIQQRFFERLSCELHNLYGPTEAAIDVSYWVCSPDDAATTVPIGRPIANTQLYILDEHLQPVPVGVCGDLYIGGTGLARGYINNEELTRERFIDDPFCDDPQARLYKTGDLSRFRADGVIEYIGRSDFQEKIRGFRIELGEIEATLDRYEDIRQAAVITRDDRPGGRYIAAYLVLHEGRRFDANALRAHLSKHLPEYMVPTALVVLEALPQLSNGKLDRKQLPAPDEANSASTKKAPQAESNTEAEILAIWRDVLGRDDIGVHENFFEAGGHSLLLGQVQNLLQSRMNISVPMVELFQFPTVHLLARHLNPTEERHETLDRGGSRPENDDCDIAVVGMAGRFPGADSVDAFWSNLRNGVESITRFTREEMLAAGASEAEIDDPDYVNAFGVLDGVEWFDASFFGMTTREAEVMDVQHRLFLETAWQALEHAGCDPQRYDGKIGVFAGTGMSTYLLYNLMTNPEAVQRLGEFQAMISNDKDYLPSYASYKMNLKGPSVSIQTACSTSLVSIHYACQSLRSGESDMALAGGVSIHLPQRKGYLYREGMILSPDGRCRAFDADAKGTVGGDGVGLVALKRLDDAVRDGDTIYAVVAGSAINNDGAVKAGYTAPSVDGQADVIRRALAQSSLSADAVGAIEAHGTGTVLGDPIEMQALQMAYADRSADVECALGSVKTNVGHLDAAAGVAGFIKSVLSVYHGEIPPSLNYEKPNPQIDFEVTPFVVSEALRSWDAGDEPRCAAVSSFGIGGTNAHVVIRQAPEVDRVETNDVPFLLPVSAKSEAALQARCEQLAAWVKDEACIGDAAYTLSLGRSEFDHRTTVVASVPSSLRNALRGMNASQVLSGKNECVFLFPGQGSQSVGMARALYERFDEYRKAFDSCCDGFAAHVGEDLRTLVFSDNPAATEIVKQTRFAQPAIVAVEIALAQLWRSVGVEPCAMLGHSIGEWAAAYLAGVFGKDDLFRLVATRGRLMQEAQPGGMIAVALSEDECKSRLQEGVSIAALNGPTQTVLSGPHDALNAVQRSLEADGVAVQKLHTSHAFHSAMMQPAADALEDCLRGVSLNAPTIPFVSNVTGDWITDEQATDPAYWSQQLRQPVRFYDGLKRIAEMTDAHRVEAGSGTALGLMVQRCGLEMQGATVSSLPHVASEQRDDATWLQAVGDLWTHGVRIRWDRLFDKETCRRVALPAYPFQRERFWIEPRPASQQTSSVTRKPGRIDDPSRWGYRPVWEARSADGVAQSSMQTVLCFMPDDPCSGGMAALVESMRKKGSQVVPVNADDAFRRTDDGYCVQPGNRKDIAALFASLHEQDLSLDTIIVGWLDRACTAEQKRERGFYHLIALAQGITDAGIGDEIRVSVLTPGIAAVAGECEPDADLAMVMGAIKTIPLEYPLLKCRCIDTTNIVRLPGVTRVLDELHRPVDDALVLLRGDARWVEAYQPMALADDSQCDVFHEGGVYLITGGLGGVGLAIAKRLAENVHARLIVTTRSAFPRRETWSAIDPNGICKTQIDAIREMEASGGTVLVVQADAGCEDDMRRAVAEGEAAFGKIRGVFHAAGVAPEGVIQRKTREGMDQLLGGKADGARNLQTVFAQRDLDFMVLFSSMATVIEEIGQADYLAANAYLDAMANSANAVVSINWDAWSESGMALRADLPEELQSAHRERLQKGIRDDEGFVVLKRILAGGDSRVIVSTEDLPTRILEHREAIAAAWTKPVLSPNEETRADLIAPRNETERIVHDIWCEIIGAQNVSVDDDFFALGGHSLLATQALSRIRNAFDVQLTLEEFFFASTIEAQAGVITQKEFEQANEGELSDILAELTLDEEPSLGTTDRN